MEVSSRTPEGIPNRCPVCGHLAVVDPSEPSGDVPCPNCGHLLWAADGWNSGALTVKLVYGDGRQEPVESVDPEDPELLRLSERLSLKDPKSVLILDFARVDTLSSFVLGRLITLDKKVKKQGGRLRLCNVRPEVYEVFATTRLDRLFEIEKR